MKMRVMTGMLVDRVSSDEHDLQRRLGVSRSEVRVEVLKLEDEQSQQHRHKHAKTGYPTDRSDILACDEATHTDAANEH
jgi:hypothetical protein